MAPHIVTTHPHDNNGFDDQHRPPGEDTIYWTELAPVFADCP